MQVKEMQEAYDDLASDRMKIYLKSSKVRERIYLGIICKFRFLHERHEHHNFFRPQL